MVENFALAQSIILFLISIDRYLNLFDNYSTYFKRSFFFIIINLLVPYLLAFIILDYYILKLVFDDFYANIIKFYQFFINKKKLI